MPRRASLIVNGVLMSACFAGLEGCIIAVINLSAAVVPPDIAARANGVLYLFFSLGTFAAPAAVRVAARSSRSALPCCRSRSPGVFGELTLIVT